MSTSKKQITANRLNAQKSTGPVTPQGKHTSSRNATTFGLYAKDIIIKSPFINEDESEYIHILESLMDELGPQGVFEEHLVLKIANCFWRFRRLIRAETAEIGRQLDSLAFDVETKDHHDLPDDLEHLDQIHAAFTPGSSVFDNKVGSRCIPTGEEGKHLMRYEANLERQLNRAYNLLRYLQSHRPNRQNNQNQRNEPISPQPYESEPVTSGGPSPFGGNFAQQDRPGAPSACGRHLAQQNPSLQTSSRAEILSRGDETSSTTQRRT
jgi:hypothetical protein